MLQSRLIKRFILAGIIILLSVATAYITKTLLNNTAEVAPDGRVTKEITCDLDCVKKKVSDLIAKEKHEEAAVYLLSYAAGNDTKTFCHFGLHLIAKGIAKKVAQEGFGEGLLPIINGCGSALIHGVAENYPYQGSLKDSVLQGAIFCNKLFEKESANWFNCVHGVGHGILKVSGNAIEESVRACRLISDLPRAVEGCIYGVYMQDKDDIAEGLIGGYAEIEDRILSTCLSSENLRYCLPSYAQLFAYYDQDKKYIELCRESEGVVLECLARLGFYQVVLASKEGDLKKNLVSEVSKCTELSKDVREFSACVVFLTHGIEGVGFKDIEPELLCGVLQELENARKIDKDSYDRPRCVVWLDRE
jgi:hypothetical protein